MIYPESGRRGLNAHHNLAWELNSSDLSSESHGTWKDLDKELILSNAKTTVLSSECFEDISPVSLEKWVQEKLSSAPSNIKIAIYIRPHISRIISFYTQSVKMGRFTGSIDAFIDRALRNEKNYYSKRILRWTRVFGEENVIIRPYIREHLVNQNVICDFASQVLNYNSDFLLPFAPKLNVNSSPSREILEIIKDYSIKLKTNIDAKKSDFYNQLLFSKIRGGLMAAYPNQGDPIADKYLVTRIYDTFREDAQEVDNRYFKSPIFSNAAKMELVKYQATSKDQTLVEFTKRERLIHTGYKSIVLQLLKYYEETE